MSLEENKGIIRSLYEAFNKHDVALRARARALDNLVAPDFVDHTMQLRGLDSFKKFETNFIKSFPDYSETIEDIIAEGDKVWVRYTLTGTHVDDLHGLAPTGKKFTESVVYIFRIVNFKIVESFQVSNPLDLLIQIGAVEYTEKGKKLLPKNVK